MKANFGEVTDGFRLSNSQSDDLSRRIAAVESELRKREFELEALRSENSQTKIRLSEALQSLKKAKSERKATEKLLFAADFLVTHSYNGAAALGRTLGRALSNLLLRLPFDFAAAAIGEIAENVERSHDFVEEIERNELSRNGKLFRNAREKAQFYRQIDIPKLQQNYDILLSNLSRPTVSAQTEPTETDEIVSVFGRLTSLCETADRLSPPQSEQIVQSLRAAVELVHARIVAPGERGLRSLAAGQSAALGHAFRLRLSEDLRARLREADQRVALLKAICDARGVSSNAQNALSAPTADFPNNLDETEVIELSRLLGESLVERESILRAKREFLSHLNLIREEGAQRLQSVFVALNAAEDEYAVCERSIAAMKRAVTANQKELRALNERNAYARAQREQLERETAVRATQSVAEPTAPIGDEIAETRKAKARCLEQLTKSVEEYSAARSELTRARVELAAAEEQLLYVDALRERAQRAAIAADNAAKLKRDEFARRTNAQFDSELNVFGRKLLGAAREMAPFAELVSALELEREPTITELTPLMFEDESESAPISENARLAIAVTRFVQKSCAQIVGAVATQSTESVSEKLLEFIRSFCVEEAHSSNALREKLYILEQIEENINNSN